MNLRSTRHGYVMVAVAAALALLLTVFPSWRWDNGRFDSDVDAAMAIAIFITTVFLIMAQGFRSGTSRILALSFLATGVVRFFASTIDTTDEVVWLHRICAFDMAVALLFESLASRGRRGEKVLTWAMSMMLILSVLLGSLVFISPHLVQDVVVDDRTTPLVAGWSLLTGALFFGSSFVWWNGREDREGAFTFVASGLFLGLTSLMYPFFPIWSGQWWVFQAIELTVSFFLAFSQLRLVYRHLVDQKNRIERTMALVTHDIRNPLGAALMSAELILEYPGHARNADLMNRVVRNLQQIEAMIQSLLDVTALRAGNKLPMKFVSCDLSAEVAHILDRQPLEVCQRVKFRADDAIVGEWGLEGIQRAVDNLLANALKYGSPTEPIGMSVVRSEDRAVISVHNEGKTIPAEEQTRLFEAFQRAKGSDYKKTGWGLGLSLVKGVAEAHGGSVQVASSDGEGTTFSMILPLRPVTVDAP